MTLFCYDFIGIFNRYEDLIRDPEVQTALDLEEFKDK